MADLQEIDGEFYIPLKYHREMYEDLFETFSSVCEELQEERNQLAELKREVTRLRRLERRQQRRYEKKKEESDGTR